MILYPPTLGLLSPSCDSELMQIKGCRSDPEGATIFRCNSAFLDKDNFICNPPAATSAQSLSHLSHSSPSSSLPVSPPVVYSVSYWDSSHAGLRLRLLPLLAEGFRPPPVSSEGLGLVLPPWEKASEGLLVVRSEYLQETERLSPNGTLRGFEEEVASRCARSTSIVNITVLWECAHVHTRTQTKLAALGRGETICSQRRCFL